MMKQKEYLEICTGDYFMTRVRRHLVSVIKFQKIVYKKTNSIGFFNLISINLFS
jgi:hypothetical protein